MKKRINIIFTLAKIILDGAAVYFSFLFAYWLRFNAGIIPVPKGIPELEVYTAVLPVVVLIFLASCKWTGLYQQRSSVYFTDEFINIFKASTTAIIMTIAATFLYRQYSYSRLVLFFAYFISIASLYILHILLRYGRIKLFSPFFGKAAVLIVGESQAKQLLTKNLERHAYFKIHHQKHTDIKKIKRMSRNFNIEEIILVDSHVRREDIVRLINCCEDAGIEFRMVPDVIELKMGEMGIDSYFGIPVLKLKHPLFEPSNYYFKRCFDIVLSMIVLILLAPFLVFVTAVIFIDSPGPVFYSHKRKGYRGRNFNFYKFRSMITDADRALKELLKYNERVGTAFKMRNDPRVTRVGKFIRIFSIDEIPQLFNVLKGDMSLVGPRPQVLWETKYYDAEAKRRLSILPGITGLWQVSGRSDLSYEDMIKLDLYYLENWTPGFDIKILLKTIPVVVLKKGAC